MEAMVQAPPVWVKERRDLAAKRFAETGYPTTRLEDWRFTNVTPIAETTFAPANTGPRPSRLALSIVSSIRRAGSRLASVSPMPPGMSSTDCAASVLITSSTTLKATSAVTARISRSSFCSSAARLVAQRAPSTS